MSDVSAYNISPTLNFAFISLPLFVSTNLIKLWYQHTGFSIKDGSEKPVYFPMVIRDWESDEDIPCWSLAALLDVLPKFIGDYGKCLYYGVGGYYCGYMDDGNFMLTIQETKADNPVDACVEMILKLKENKLI